MYAKWPDTRLHGREREHVRAENVQKRKHNMCYLFAYLLPMYGEGGRRVEKKVQLASLSGKVIAEGKWFWRKKRWLVICAHIIGLESPPVRR